MQVRSQARARSLPLIGGDRDPGGKQLALDGNSLRAVEERPYRRRAGPFSERALRHIACASIKAECRAKRYWPNVPY